MRHIELAVGGFMIMGMIAITLMAFRVSGISVESGSGTYTLIARFDNLGGLTERSKVSMSGVTIGKVKSIYFDPERYEAVVEMSIDNSVNTLSTDTSAAILTAGLIGEKYIGLEVGGEFDNLQDGDEITDTQSAVVLEDLISRFMFSQAEGDN